MLTPVFQELTSNPGIPNNATKTNLQKVSHMINIAVIATSMALLYSGLSAWGNLEVTATSLCATGYPGKNTIATNQTGTISNTTVNGTISIKTQVSGGQIAIASSAHADKTTVQAFVSDNIQIAVASGPNAQASNIDNQSYVAAGSSNSKCNAQPVGGNRR